MKQIDFFHYKRDFLFLENNIKLSRHRLDLTLQVSKRKEHTRSSVSFTHFSINFYPLDQLASPQGTAVGTWMMNSLAPTRSKHWTILIVDPCGEMIDVKQKSELYTLRLYKIPFHLSFTVQKPWRLALFKDYLHLNCGDIVEYLYFMTEVKS